MNFSRISHNFRQFPFYAKLAGIGSLLLALSTFLPWYSDLDSFRIGDTFLGITGPASFVGVAILLLSAVSFVVFGAPLLDRRKPKLPLKEGVFHLFVGIQSLFLLFLVNSIYFDPKFGVNITLKESGFGMLMAFVGAALLSFGGYFQNKNDAKTEDLIGRLEPLVELPKQTPSAQVPVPERKHVPLQQSKPAGKTWGPVEISQAQLIKEKMETRMQMRETAQAVTQAMPGKSAETSTLAPVDKKDGTYMLRMDL